MLSVSNVRKTFGGLVAVDDVSFEIGAGEIVGLIGPNGAGKTTLFNTISGIYTPDDGGSIRFQGAELTGKEPHLVAREGLVRTFQIVRVFTEMSVLDNATIGASFGEGADSPDREEAERRGRETLEFVGLAAQADKQADRLTIAEQKQLELARALSTEPDLVMLDEIASGLAPSEIEELSALIGRLRDERGISVFWIEHIVDAIMGTVDRVIVIESGAKIAEGAPREIQTDERVLKAYLGEERRKESR
jgi:branched-chain amino acid transport system ATP-binding protein